MRKPIHLYYDQLTDNERRFVDKIFHHREMYEWAQHFDVPLAGDDRIERAIDALARAVIESRPKQPSGVWPDWGNSPRGFDGPGGAE